MDINKQLESELKQLIKRANRRILNIERLTNLKGSFATKQLYDYLESVNGLTKSGQRIRSNITNLTLTQKLGIRTAINQFIKSDVSTIRGIKSKMKHYETLTEKKLSFKQSNIIYLSGKDYTWIYDYMTKSEFWGVWVKLTNQENWSKKQFAEEIAERIEREIDEQLRYDLESLYYYIKD